MGNRKDPSNQNVAPGHDHPSFVRKKKQSFQKERLGISIHHPDMQYLTKKKIIKEVRESRTPD